VVEARGAQARRFEPGQRVGVAWLHRSCGHCEFCASGRENLCDRPEFTGWTVDGGYAEFIVAPEAFVYPSPSRQRSPNCKQPHSSAPASSGLLAAARESSRIAPRPRRLRAAAHIAIQVARHRGAEVYAITRELPPPRTRPRTWRRLGGLATEKPRSASTLPSSSPRWRARSARARHAPQGRRAGARRHYMSPIPALDYSLLYQERVIRSVANNTRADGEDFLRVAAEIPIRTEVQRFASRGELRARGAGSTTACVAPRCSRSATARERPRRILAGDRGPSASDRPRRVELCALPELSADRAPLRCLWRRGSSASLPPGW
jgi:propanol-preferring alcohol dehydrogenase